MDVREAVQIDEAYRLAMRELQAAIIVINNFGYERPNEDCTDRVHDRMARTVSVLSATRRLLRIDRPDELNSVSNLIHSLNRAMITLETSRPSYIRTRELLSRAYSYLEARAWLNYTVSGRPLCRSVDWKPQAAAPSCKGRCLFCVSGHRHVNVTEMHCAVSLWGGVFFLGILPAE